MIEVELISPTKMVERRTIKMVVIPAVEGNIGVMRNHIPFSSTIKPGLLKFYDQDDHLMKSFFVAKGFVNVSGEKCSVLAEWIKSDWGKAEIKTLEKQIKDLEEELAKSKERANLLTMKEELGILKAHYSLLMK